VWGVCGRNSNLTEAALNFKAKTSIKTKERFLEEKNLILDPQLN
jgi:hypothetical protein